jgi:PAS domain S-box-containing protein
MDVLKDILDNLSDSIVIIDPNGQIVLYNNEALRIQKSVSEKPIEIGNYFTDLVSDDQKMVVTDIITAIRKQKKRVKNFVEYHTPRGARVSLEVSFIPVLGVRKELRYINVISQDITSRKVFEKKVRAATADVNNLIENAHAIIFSVDSRGYIVEWNNHSAELTGFTKNDVLSKKLTEVLISEYNAPLFDDLMSTILKNHPVGNYEFPIQTQAGKELVVMLSATPRTNANGDVIGATLVGQDITELTAYRRSLEKLVQNKTAALQNVLKKEKEAVDMKSRFVSIASHEFRTPLSSIDFAASFIKQNAATIGKKKLNEKVQVIEKHVSYMSHLLDDVLNYSKNENGKIRIIPSEICLEKFIKQAVEEVTCSSKHSHHICVSANKFGRLVTDEKLLRNVVINLLTNAIKFSPGKDEVTLNLLDHQEFITIQVADEGIGIAEEEMELIFEPFIRGKAADAIQGTGLGLSIVKKAVELLDGSMEVDSTPGQGSVFTVTIPRKLG